LKFILHPNGILFVKLHALFEPDRKGNGYCIIHDTIVEFFGMNKGRCQITAIRISSDLAKTKFSGCYRP
jgi:hypothetical protein